MLGRLRKLFNRQPSPEQAEARRRAGIHQNGRVIAGVIVDILEDGGIVYRYHVAGVHYTATQDGPAPAPRWLGPVRVKYALRNPANSMILLENGSDSAAGSGAQPEA